MRARANRDVIEDYRDGNMPRKATYSLQDKGSQVRMTLMSEALDAEGIDRSGEVTQAFYEEEGVIVIDLRGGERE
jgi:hypothetical protein